MSKRTNISNDNPPAKRPRGFRFVRTNPEAARTPSPSVFVTVNTDDQHSGTLNAQTHFFLAASTHHFPLLPLLK